MTSNIQFKALYGTRAHEPLCFLLEVDYCKILLDVGWDYCFSDEDVAPLKSLGRIDAVLLSHASIQHLGALPYAVAKLGLSCPIYCTLPTLRMGKLFMEDAYQNLMKRNSEFHYFTQDDIQATFERFVQLKYSQDCKLPDRGDEITITPYAAGNMLGGTVWRITKETEDLVYAVDFNHKRERHLDATTLDTLRRPAVLIGDCLNAGVVHPQRKHRDKHLLQLITERLTSEDGAGSVLIPTDTAGRCLELLLILHQHWSNDGLSKKFSLVFLSNNPRQAITNANSMIEWMSDNMRKHFDNRRSSAFAFENLRICTDPADLDKLPKPQVVLATSPYMEGDFSQDLFLEWSSNPRNLVIFTQRAPAHTLAGKLMAEPNRTKVQFTTTQIVPLEGEELAEWRQMKKEERMEKAAMSGNQSDSEDEEFEAITIEDAELVVNPQQKSNKVSIVQMFPMFTETDTPREFDDYGEVVDFANFLPKEGEQEDEIEAFVPENKKGFADMIDDDEDDEVPVKTVSRDLELNVRCRIEYIDFEGRSDGQSISRIYGKMMPRKMILVHGTEDGTKTMKDLCERNITKEVMVSLPNKTLDITSDASTFSVSLKDTLAQSLKFFTIPEVDYEVAYIDGVISGETAYSGIKYLEANRDGKARGHPRVFLGDVKLIDVKNSLNKSKIPSEFINGVLVVGKSGLVQIQKISPTQIHISGGLCDEYFQIRNVLYSKFQIV